ncbi:hypothetical protein JNUCC23_02575 [Peribacillus sp. JNUCC 23]
MALIKRKYICPYCFTKHKMHEVEFRCSNENHREQDKKFGDYWGQPAPFEQKVLPASERNTWEKLKSSMPESTVCEECETKPVTRKRICPTCHSDLPSSIADYEDYIIAVIGGKETGKSHYIAMLIERINNELGNTYNCFLQPENDETIRRYKENFYNPLFREKRALNVTDSANSNDEIKRPLLYTLSINGDGVLGKKIITLAFFDTAGEDLHDEGNMLKHNRYICNSSGVICLLDPLQLDSVRKEISDNHLPVTLPQDNPNGDVSDLLSRTTNMIRNTLHIKMSKKIPIPMALSFSKIDAIQPLLDPSSQLNQKGQHMEKNAFDIVDFENIHKEMEGLVQEWTRGNIPNLLSHNYKEYAYFGLSALGHDPRMGVKEIVPYRVEDPFLWLLWKNKIINGVNRK